MHQNVSTFIYLSTAACIRSWDYNKEYNTLYIYVVWYIKIQRIVLALMELRLFQGRQAVVHRSWQLYFLVTVVSRTEVEDLMAHSRRAQQARRANNVEWKHYQGLKPSHEAVPTPVWFFKSYFWLHYNIKDSGPIFNKKLCSPLL